MSKKEHMNTSYIRQAHEEKQVPRKNKVLWKLLKFLLRFGWFIYRIWKFFDDSEG